MKPVGNEFQSHLNAVKIEAEHNFREHITVSKSETSLLFETRKCCSKTKRFICITLKTINMMTNFNLCAFHVQSLWTARLLQWYI